MAIIILGSLEKWRDYTDLKSDCKKDSIMTVDECMVTLISIANQQSAVKSNVKQTNSIFA